MHLNKSILLEQNFYYLNLLSLIIHSFNLSTLSTQVIVSELQINTSVRNTITVWSTVLIYRFGFFPSLSPYNV